LRTLWICGGGGVASYCDAKKKTKLVFIVKHRKPTAATLTGECKNESSWSA